jgi:hypothetical protein
MSGNGKKRGRKRKPIVAAFLFAGALICGGTIALTAGVALGFALAATGFGWAGVLAGTTVAGYVCGTVHNVLLAPRLTKMNPLGKYYL